MGSDLIFDGSSTLPEHRPILDEITLHVLGHTDMKGSYHCHLQHSKDRGRSLVDILVKEWALKVKCFSLMALLLFRPELPTKPMLSKLGTAGLS